MDNFTPDESQLKALKTWYPESHELHLNPRHPCIKLAGEAGELLDLYGKEEYKPGFSWWDCAKCNTFKRAHDEGYQACKGEYTPKVLDETGDYSYYLRILTYQKEVSFDMPWNKLALNTEDNLDFILARLNNKSANIYMGYLTGGYIFENDLKVAIFWFKALLHKLDCSLENLLELNYRKLNSEETNHGWKDATAKR